MDFISEYKKKLTTAAEAVKAVKSGDWVDYGFCVLHPVDLDDALAVRLASGEVTDVNFRGGVAMRTPAVAQVPDAASKMSWNSWHCTGADRKLVGSGIGFYSPFRFSEGPRYYRENTGRVNVAMFQVAPMDAHGYFNFGISASHMAAMIDVSDKIIVEVNKNVPVALGGTECNIHISRVDMVVEGSNTPMGQLGAAAPSDVDEAVAKLIVAEIPNGACLQLGIGGMPNAVGSLIARSDLKDLGVHTEMYVDAFVDIAAAGKITNVNKAANKGRSVFSFGAGTQKLYDLVNNNPAIMAAPVDYVNDIRTISAIDNFMSINNAVDIDLFGQVASETSGTRHISGAGGQLDFVLGAYLSKGGKSFICCSSTVTDKSGNLQSRLAPTLPTGSIVTDTRANIHYLVTEYGIVNLKGTTTWQRADKIISVAHPQFRDQLIADAQKLGIWKKSNKR